MSRFNQIFSSAPYS